jgi:hypothetical protein
VPWSIAASRCRPGQVAPSASVCREPRRDLPSTVSTRRRPAGATAAVRVARQRRSRVEPVGVHLPNQPSDGRLRGAAPVHTEGNARSMGRSATHSATATNDRTPAATAHSVAVSTTATPWRIPRRSRGSTSPPGPSAGSGRARPHQVARSRPPVRRHRRWTRMHRRTRLSPGDHGVRTAMITTRAVSAPLPRRMSPQLSDH